MTRKETLNGAIDRTRQWLSALLTRRASAPANSMTDSTFWREDEGTFYLTGADAEEYARCLESLATVAGRTDAIGIEAVAQALQTALFSVVDIPGKRPTDPDRRIGEAIGELRRALTGPLVRFQVYVPVGGLDPVGLPAKVGNIEFAVFDQSSLGRFPQGEDELRSDSEIFGRTAAIAEVEALEWGGARTRGIQAIRLVVDCINFFTEMVRYNRAQSALEDQLIASIQWAGRATVAPRREEAFLLYAIALESFVLADQSPLELGYRLRLRVAHLLGKTAEVRQRLFDQVAQLYTIRSKIVHSGEYRVTEADLGLMQWMCKAALLRACISEDFLKMSNTKDLQQWFQDRLLD